MEWTEEERQQGPDRSWAELAALQNNFGPGLRGQIRLEIGLGYFAAALALTVL